jgi:energy-converting hydrogenase Eha subunit A
VFIPVIVEDWSMKFYYAGSLAVALLLVSCVFAVPSVNAANAAENSWKTMALMPTARVGLCVAVVNGKIYAIGGQHMGGVLGVNEMYDPAANTWVTKKPMPTPRSNFAIAVFHNKIYCIGGLLPYTGVNEVYDPATDTWETKQPMPTPRGASSACVVNGKIYVIGGLGPQYADLPELKQSELNEVYDPVADSWTTMAPLPTAVWYSVLAVVDNKIYVFGNGDAAQIYDPQTNTWRYGPSMPYSVAYGAVAATTGVFAPKKIYCIGGTVYSKEIDPETHLLKTVSLIQIFDPKTETWSTGAAMPTSRILLGVAVVDDLLYAIGGESPGAPLRIYDVNERYTPFGYVGTVPPVVDVVPPEIKVLSPETTTYNVSSVPLVFTVSNPINWTGYSLDGRDNVTITGNTTLSGLSNGLHNVTVYARDEFENTGASETISFTIEAPFPVVPVAAASAASVAVIGLVLLVYFKKRRHQTSLAS